MDGDSWRPTEPDCGGGNSEDTLPSGIRWILDAAEYVFSVDELTLPPRKLDKSLTGDVERKDRVFSCRDEKLSARRIFV